MFSAKGRYLLMVATAVSAIGCVFYREYQLASFLGLMLLLLIWSHFKQSSVLLASKHFKNGNYEAAEVALDEVPDPERLAKNRRGYYEFMRANIALHRELYDEAEYHFQLASRFPLGGKTDKVFVMIHLANLALRKKDKKRILAYLDIAKEMASTPRAKEIINKIEREANSL
jgi:outer membrane protein assembly factor BamD (BamD/ComL family)